MYVIDILLLFGVKKDVLSIWPVRAPEIKPVLSAAVLPLAHYLSSNGTL
jgi:hypothetical protein